jgi:hypothetical protein
MRTRLLYRGKTCVGQQYLTHRWLDWDFMPVVGDQVCVAGRNFFVQSRLWNSDPGQNFMTLTVIDAIFPLDRELDTHRDLLHASGWEDNAG